MDKQIEENFGLIFPIHMSLLTEFLIDCRRSFGGDLDSFLIASIIGERTFSAKPAHEGIHYGDWRAGRSTLSPEPVNKQCIAEYSGIPRETVRRKLGVLLECGWVHRDENGLLTGTEVARADLQPLTDSALRYLTRMFGLMRKVERKCPLLMDV